MHFEDVKRAVSAIRATRFRSFLTMLGIIIGVVSVITVASLGEGVKHQIQGQTSSVGKDLITIRPGKLVNRDSGGHIKSLNLLSLLSSNTISEKDIEDIGKDADVKSAVPFSIINGVPSIGDKRFTEGFVMATSSKMPDVSGGKIEFGNFFGNQLPDRRVAIIGKSVAEKLFEENVPVGKTMQIRGEDFVVSGVFEKFPANPLNPEADFNNGVFIPYEAGKAISGNSLTPYEILVRPKSKDQASVDKTIASLSSILKKNHAGQEDFTVLRQDEMELVANNLLHLITRTVAIMAAITLIVGGVGIMNVMLVSVTERTREIGIRKSVGATNHQIQTQFLIEAVVISLWGALIGIIFSVIINFLIRIFTNLQPVIDWKVAAIAAGISVVVGVIFGMIPAIKASLKDPIEALRSSE